MRDLRLGLATQIAVALTLNGAELLAPSGACAVESEDDAGKSGSVQIGLSAGSAQAALPRPVGLIINGRLAPYSALIAETHETLVVRRPISFRQACRCLTR